MTMIRVAGALLASDRGARTVTYRLLPFGEPGRTSRGTVTVAPGVVQIPDPASVVLNMEHDPTRPVGRAVAIVEDQAALVATFRVAETTAGDDLLAEVEAGLRPGASVELVDVAIRGGALTAGRLIGAGAVVSPAFPSAQALLVAADTDPDPETDDPETDDPETPPQDPAVDDPMEDPTVTETLTPVESAGQTLLASLPAGVPTPPPARDQSLADVTSLLAAASAGQRTPELLAALSNLTQTANAAVAAPQWLAEVWSGAPYQRQVVPLLSQGTLRAAKIVGWRWKVRPTGAEYAGDKTEVPSNAADTEAVEASAARWAGAHDIDRALRDFGGDDFWTSYWQAMAASYGAWSDAEATTQILTDAPAVVPDADGVVPAIIKAVLAVLPKGAPTFCLMGSAAYADLAMTDPLAFLSGNVALPDGAGNVGGLAFRANAALGADQIVVGNRNAVTWYELGESPIRVDAVNVAHGGVDVGAFGYGVALTNDPAGLAKTTITRPAPAARKA